MSILSLAQMPRRKKGRGTELQLIILSNLSLADKHCLRLTSKAFNNLLILDLPLEQLKVARNNQTLFVVDDAEDGDLGFEPFIIENCRKITHDFARHEHILVDIYYPRYMQNNDKEHGDVDDHNKDDCIGYEWQIHIDMRELWLDTNYKLESNSKRFVKSVDYELLRGKLVQVSASLMRNRFECPECRDSRDVCPGCGGFYSRFPDLSCGCGWPMPCPVCIGYEVAEDAKYIQDDQEELDKLWEEINEMLAEDGADAKA